MTDFNIPASLLDENLPHSIRQMDLAEKERLARDIRQTIIQVVAKTADIWHPPSELWN